MTDDWPRPVVHFEIEALDPERQRAFYAGMFSWGIGDGPIMSFSAGIGGPEPGPGGHIRSGQAGRVTLYVQVRDLHESLARAVELGGAAASEPFDLPGAPTMAMIDDPEGNRIMLVLA